MLDKQGRCGNALSIQTFHKASLCFSLCHQAAIGENANLKRRPMCVRGFPELLKRNVAFRRVRIPFARRDAFARLRLKDVNVDLRHRLSECAERENWPGAMAVLERQMRWCSLSDEDPRQITWLSTQPAKLIEEFRTAPEATSKQMANKRCATCFVEPHAFWFSSGMWRCQSRIPFGKSSLRKTCSSSSFSQSCRQIVGDANQDWAQQQNSDALFRCLQNGDLQVVIVFGSENSLEKAASNSCSMRTFWLPESCVF
ncbi:Hypothetical_protein [Hexamita inflata]|uniref:Hypothetical_protein n=1 Tax=Hexamita inflata TaxID=28002 RepID=A0AA86TM03_9EUKA|nr:Hypothetical protein HINF_LOCUS9046 [Hexamita inflata]